MPEPPELPSPIYVRTVLVTCSIVLFRFSHTSYLATGPDRVAIGSYANDTRAKHASGSIVQTSPCAYLRHHSAVPP